MIDTSERAQPPIRWPRPSPGSVACVALWAVGAIVAVFVPYLIVPTGASNAPASQVWTAFGFTVLGAIIMIVAAALLARRLRQAGVVVVGCVPAIVMIIGGIILATTKLT